MVPAWDAESSSLGPPWRALIFYLFPEVTMATSRIEPARRIGGHVRPKEPMGSKEPLGEHGIGEGTVRERVTRCI